MQGHLLPGLDFSGDFFEKAQNPEKSRTSDRMFCFSLDFAPFRKNLRKNPSREGDGLAFLGKA